MRSDIQEYNLSRNNFNRQNDAIGKRQTDSLLADQSPLKRM